MRRERAVADLQFDDVLAAGLELLGDGEDVEGGLGGQAAGERGVCVGPELLMTIREVGTKRVLGFCSERLRIAGRMKW